MGGESGEIVTPNYPLEYPRKLDCVWNIKVSVHKVLKLRFLKFDLERHNSCKYDYVEIRDGLSVRSPELGTYCGTSLPSKSVDTVKREHGWRIRLARCLSIPS